MQERAELYMARTCPAQDLYRALTGARADSLHNSYHGSTGLAQAPYKNRAGPLISERYPQIPEGYFMKLPRMEGDISFLHEWSNKWLTHESAGRVGSIF